LQDLPDTRAADAEVLRRLGLGQPAMKEKVNEPLAWCAFRKGVVDIVDKSLDVTIVTA
jgi:hypothetical protein